MSNYDNLAKQIAKLQAIVPAQYTATKTGEEMNVSDALKMVTMVVNVGAVSAADATHYFTFTVTQATASGGSFSAADANQYLDTANSWDRIINATGEASDVYSFDFEIKPGYPIVKLVATESGGSADVNFGAICIFHPGTTPAT